jgi:hypothetical protein
MEYPERGQSSARWQKKKCFGGGRESPVMIGFRRQIANSKLVLRMSMMRIGRGMCV